MGYERVASAGRVHRYAAPYSPTARYVDIVEDPDGGAGGERARRGASHRVRGRRRRRPGPFPAEADRRRPSGHAAHRPHLFPLDLFPGARAGCCSRSRPRVPGSRSTSRARRSGRAQAAAAARAPEGPPGADPAAAQGRLEVEGGSRHARHCHCEERSDEAKPDGAPGGWLCRWQLIPGSRSLDPSIGILVTPALTRGNQYCMPDQGQNVGNDERHIDRDLMRSVCARGSGARGRSRTCKPAAGHRP